MQAVEEGYFAYVRKRKRGEMMMMMLMLMLLMLLMLMLLMLLMMIMRKKRKKGTSRTTLSSIHYYASLPILIHSRFLFTSCAFCSSLRFFLSPLIISHVMTRFKPMSLSGRL
jgi:hypothetical protein